MKAFLQVLVAILFVLLVILPIALVVGSFWNDSKWALGIGIGILVFDLIVVVSVGIRILIKSKDNIGPEEVALKSYTGKLDESEIYQPGPVTVLWIPLYKWIYGRPYCELVRVPREPMKFTLGGDVGHKIRSSDKVPLLVNFSGFVVFPYLEPESLALMIKSKVPFNMAAFDKWVTSEMVTGLRDIMAAYTHKEAIERSNLTDVNKEAKEFFLLEDGLFATSGILGNDKTNFKPGRGEVKIRIEDIAVPEKIDSAMQEKVEVEYLTMAAEERIALAGKEAQASAALFDDTNQALKAWLADNPKATPQRIKEKQEELRQRALAKTPGYRQTHVKGLERATTVVIGGDGAGLLVGGGGGGGKKSKKAKDDKRGNMSDADFKSI
jgi:hypothetical protein